MCWAFWRWGQLGSPGLLQAQAERSLDESQSRNRLLCGFGSANQWRFRPEARLQDFHTDFHVDSDPVQLREDAEETLAERPGDAEEKHLMKGANVCAVSVWHELLFGFG